MTTESLEEEQRRTSSSVLQPTSFPPPTVLYPVGPVVAQEPICVAPFPTSVVGFSRNTDYFTGNESVRQSKLVVELGPANQKYLYRIPMRQLLMELANDSEPKLELFVDAKGLYIKSHSHTEQFVGRMTPSGEDRVRNRTQSPLYFLASPQGLTLGGQVPSARTQDQAFRQRPAGLAVWQEGNAKLKMFYPSKRLFQDPEVAPVLQLPVDISPQIAVVVQAGGSDFFAHDIAKNVSDKHVE